MMKIGLALIGILTATLLALNPGNTLAQGSERGTVQANISGAHISIDYGRPVLRGRDMLKQIQPGQVWRLGAGAPTTLESDKPLNFGGITVPQGKHILLARLVEPGKWTLVFSSKSAFQYEPSAKIAEVPLDFHETSDAAELVTITLTDKDGMGALEIAWGKMHLSASFKAA